MLFNSLGYFVFLPITFGIYWILKDKYRYIFLLVASYFFYMCSGIKYGLLIFIITLVSYISAIIIEKSFEKKKRIFVLCFNILVCLGLLFYFKYFNFFSNTFNSLLKLIGIQQDSVMLDIILPVGISFYTFQTMSYVIDVYKGITKAEYNFGKYAAFVSFFPQLVAGPIERSNNLLSQINQHHNFNYDQAMYGVKLMILGYYKKLVIADNLSQYVQKIYNDPNRYVGFSLVMATIFFAIQIYCDFSGYSDIAIGTAKLFGINLMTNFKSPYFSKSIKEFWSRWHISLSTWFRDYVYIPLGGNRVCKLRHYLNLMITFLVSGFWHGANWTFIVWGGIHGLAQLLENTVFSFIYKQNNKYIKLIKLVMVFVFCSFAWVFFVSNSINDALHVIKNCLVGISNPSLYINNGFIDMKLNKSWLAIFVACILMMTYCDYISSKGDFIAYLSKKK